MNNCSNSYTCEMSGKKTPRHLIQEYADNVETEKSLHPRRRRPLSRSPEGASISQQPTVSSTTHEPTRSATKRRRTGEEEEFTPRHLIQGVLDTQDTAKPSTRKSRKAGTLLPPSSSKVKKSRRRSSLGVPSMEKMVSQFTPRSMITGFLEQGEEETPEQRATKEDKSSSRSSFGDLPNNEISFHPVEASFHETKLAKEAKKTKGDRSRAAIHIVRRRSEKLARAAGEEIDFSNEDESDDSDEHLEGAEQGRCDLSGRQSGYVSSHDVDDTSAKDTSSVDPSPRKSFSQRRATPSKRESVASLKNASHLSPNKSLEVSLALSGQLSPRETTPSRMETTPSKEKTTSRTTPKSTGGSQCGAMTRKSRSRSSFQRNVSKADAVETAEADEITDDVMSIGADDESVKSRGNMSELKSRVGEVADGSDLQPSPRNKSRSRGYDHHTPSQKEERIQRRSRSVSNSKFEEESVDHSNHDNTGLSTPGRDSKSRSCLEPSTPRSRSRSRSKSRSRLSDNIDEEDGKGANHNEEIEDDDDHHSSLDVNPDEVDEPRSGRSSPRHSTGLIKNVYDFHDDSPSKRIIGKLAKTLQRSATVVSGENISDDDAMENDGMAGETHYENMSDDEDHYGDEPEESIIPTTDREIHTYYTPLRTPHLKEKTSSKPVSMVTSTPKPPSAMKKQQAARPKGRQKTSEKKKDTGYMPASVVKGLFTHFCPSKVAKETIAEVEKASAQFWENAAKDLESYALHAHRKTIEEADVELLMKRQKFITPKESLPALVEKYLPLELRQEIIPMCRSGNKLELK